jgi:hypothetical protein
MQAPVPLVAMGGSLPGKQALCVVDGCWTCVERAEGGRRRIEIRWGLRNGSNWDDCAFVPVRSMIKSTLRGISLAA